MLLAGDIGGTKSDLAVFSPEQGPRNPVHEATFMCDQYSGLEAIVLDFLEQGEIDIAHACFGVAGPVIDGRVKITNLPWIIDAKKLEDTLSLKSVRLLNDLEAIAFSIPHLEGDDLLTLYDGEPEEKGAIAVIAPGTGLGEAFLVREGSKYRAHCSEGGHCDFAPNSFRELSLLRYLKKRFDHVSVERVCSGSGIPNIYAYLKEQKVAEEPAWFAEKLKEADDPTPLIADTALERGDACPLCSETLNMFVSILGAEAGNLALKVLATGGVYLGGGIPPRIISSLKGPHFIAAFQSKGRLSNLISRIPVHIIMNPKAALLGAASVELEELSNNSESAIE